MSSQVNWTRPLILAGTLTVLGSAAYWLEYSHKPKKEEATEQEKKFLRLKGTPIASIRLATETKSFAFQCLDLEAKLCKPGDNSRWEVTAPAKFRGDDSNINALISALNTMQASEILDLSAETAEKRTRLFKEYGLDPTLESKSRRVEIVTGDGEKRLLILGDAHPIGDSIFVRSSALGDQKAALIPSFFKSNFDKELSHWRDKKLVTLASHQIQSFELNGTKAKIQGSRSDGQWTLTGNLAGDIEAIDTLMNAATYLSAKAFANEKKAGAPELKGLSPLLTLALKPEKAKDAKEEPAPVKINLFEKKSGTAKVVYATVSNLDPVFELEASVIERLDKDLKNLRLMKLITSMDRFGLKRIEISGKPVGEPALVITGEDLKKPKITALLDKLSGNRIRDFLSGSTIPAGEADGVRISLGDEKESARRKLVFWKKGDRLYARDLLSKRAGEAFEVDSTIAEALPFTRDFLK